VRGKKAREIRRKLFKADVTHQPTLKSLKTGEHMNQYRRVKNAVKKGLKSKEESR